MSRTISTISLIWPLSDISDFHHSGPDIAFSLSIPLYASMLRATTLLLTQLRSEQ